MKSKATIEKTSRQVIENKLLTALNDSSQVAILATEEDLSIMIETLSQSERLKAREMARDFEQLRKAAFKK